MYEIGTNETIFINEKTFEIMNFDKATKFLSKKSIWSYNQAELRLSWIEKLFKLGKKIPKIFTDNNKIIIKPAEFYPYSEQRFNQNVIILQDAIKEGRFSGKIKFQDLSNSKKVAFYCANRVDYNLAKWLIGA